MRVLSAMSGGVDSSVATARLLAAGHQVSGVYLSLHGRLPGTDSMGRGCASPTDEADARRVAELLGIDLQVWDFSERFADEIVSYFLAEYASGRTPNPCLRCNQRIKFAALLDEGLSRGFDAVATGHYARRIDTADGVQLWRAADQAKDQSYVLGVLNAHQLEHSLFPLGDSMKSEVRAEAARLGLGVADKPDSLDLCFVTDGDTAGFLADRLGELPGQIVDLAGRQLGSHQGTHRFTVGQRKGLNLGVPAIDGRPRYVVGINADNRDIIVGPAEELSVNLLETIRPTWTGAPRTAPWRGLVQIRAHGEPLPALIEPVETGSRIKLDSPHRGVAPGQYAICYDGQQVIGSGVIAVTRRATALVDE